MITKENMVLLKKLVEISVGKRTTIPKGRKITQLTERSMRVNIYPGQQIAKNSALSQSVSELANLKVVKNLDTQPDYQNSSKVMETTDELEETRITAQIPGAVGRKNSSISSATTS